MTPLGFGVRTAAAAMLALYVAFALRLDDPGWAGTSAVIVAQPLLGATLRKGSLRLVGTLVGAVAAVLLTKLFPQDRVGFLLGLAVWGGLCSFAATLLGELLSYAPLLAGYTCAIVATAAIADPPSVLLAAVARGSCIALGIVATTTVFALTTRGTRRAELAAALGGLADEAIAGLRSALDGEIAAGAQDRRRALVARTAALDTMIDQAAGENLDLRSRLGTVRQAVSGVFAILSSWRGAEQHLGRAASVAPPGIRPMLDAALAAVAPREAARAMTDIQAASVSERLLLDRAAHAVAAFADVQDGLMLLRFPLRAGAPVRMAALLLGDPVVAGVNAVRSVLTVAAASAIWVATGWAGGATFVTFAMVIALLFGLRDERAFSSALGMAGGCAAALVVAALIRFVAMPLLQGHGFDTYAAFCAAVGLPLLCLGWLAVALPAASLPASLVLFTMANVMPMLSRRTRSSMTSRVS